MKTILQILLIAAAILIQTSTVKGQYTYQTPLRSAFIGTLYINTDSNNTLQPGIGTGCALVTTQPVWILLGACGTGFLSFMMHTNSTSTYDTLSLIFYGPFADTLNLGSKLINSNIDTCLNAYVFNSLNLLFYKNNYQRGDIYIALIMTSANIETVTFQGGASFIETDSAFCPLCNSQLSELYQPICTVTCDSATQKNKIIWTKDIFTPAEDYVIFRKNITGTYDTIAYQNISQLSEFTDVTSSPLSKAHVYKLGIRDSCGQIMNKDYLSNGLTPTFTTMHLIAYPTGLNSAGLIWNKGSFQGPFYIYRTDPFGVTALIDSVGLMTDPQTYTDINAPAGLCSYQIGVNLNPPCVASVMPSYTMVKSNPGYVTVTGINELTDLSKAITVEPNPFNQYTKIDLHLLSKQNLKVVLINLTGQVVMQLDNVKTDELIIERNNLSQGLYFLEVTGDGFYARKKLVVK